MSKFQKFITLVSVLGLSPFLSNAQDQLGSRSFFESNNKIFVVVMVLATILIGIFIVLFFLERKIKRIERDQKLV